MQAKEAIRLTNYSLDRDMCKIFEAIKCAAAKSTHEIVVYDLLDDQVTRLRDLKYTVNNYSDTFTIKW